MFHLIGLVDVAPFDCKWEQHFGGLYGLGSQTTQWTVEFAYVLLL